MKNNNINIKTINVKIKNACTLSGSLNIPEHLNNEIAVLIIPGS